MERLGYYNGKYGPLEEMMVPMNDRVSWFGDGVYDAGPCRNYHIFALDEHVDRIDGIAVGGRDAALYEKIRKYLLDEFYQKTS